MRQLMWAVVLVTIGVLGLYGCSSAPSTPAAQADLQDETGLAFNRFLREDPTFGDFISHAYGYVMFPSVGKGGIGVGGASGWGVVYEHGQPIGHASLSQVTVGAQLGGQTFSELVAFQDPAALERFKAGQTAFSANASAVWMKSGAAASAKYDNGVAVFLLAKGGMMFEASIGGQGFKFTPLAAAAPAGH